MSFMPLYDQKTGELVPDMYYNERTGQIVRIIRTDTGFTQESNINLEDSVTYTIGSKRCYLDEYGNLEVDEHGNPREGIDLSCHPFKATKEDVEEMCKMMRSEQGQLIIRLFRETALEFDSREEDVPDTI